MEKLMAKNAQFFQPGRLKLLFLLGLIVLASCSPAVAETPTAAAPTVAPTETAIAPTATLAPSATATLAPTETQVPTPTPVPPTDTPVPPLAVLDDGFNVWCTPLDYAGVVPEGPDEPAYARKMSMQGDLLLASIPAVYCTLVYHFNQPVPQGLTLAMMEGKSVFLKQTLVAANNQPDVAWTSVSHSYVVNPPFWWVDYTVAVLDPTGKELWSKLVRFIKPLPETCVYGGLPDPVTLWCPITDPWEVEPHPDTTYPWDRSRLTPDP